MKTVDQFRADFPEFADDTKYPDSQVSFWLAFAYQMLNPNRWMQILDIGAELFTAHNLVLEVTAVAQAQNGAPPGTVVGPVNARAVDGVSVSYDTASGVEMDAGHWNMSSFGTRFIRICRMMGAGPIQVGIGRVPFGAAGGIGGSPWVGPPIWPPY